MKPGTDWAVCWWGLGFKCAFFYCIGFIMAINKIYKEERIMDKLSLEMELKGNSDPGRGIVSV